MTDLAEALAGKLQQAASEVFFAESDAAYRKRILRVYEALAGAVHPSLRVAYKRHVQDCAHACASPHDLLASLLDIVSDYALRPWFVMREVLPGGALEADTGKVKPRKAGSLLALLDDHPFLAFFAERRMFVALPIERVEAPQEEGAFCGVVLYRFEKEPVAILPMKVYQRMQNRRFA